jgi:hypothetical protein
VRVTKRNPVLGRMPSSAMAPLSQLLAHSPARLARVAGKMAELIGHAG